MSMDMADISIGFDTGDLVVDADPNVLFDDDMMDFFLSSDTLLDTVAMAPDHGHGTEGDNFGSASSDNKASTFSSNAPTAAASQNNGINSTSAAANNNQSWTNISSMKKEHVNTSEPSTSMVMGNHNKSNSNNMSTIKDNMKTDQAGLKADTSAADSKDRRQRRLARNRESARQSRRRKKQYLELLEEKVQQLTKEIESHRHIHLRQAVGAIRRAKESTIRSTLQNYGSASSSNAAQLRENLDMLQRRFGPNCEERRTVLEYHFGQFMNLLVPPYTRFLLWVVNQGPSFFKNSQGSGRIKTKASSSVNNTSGVGGASSLWPLLSNELGLTFEQEENLKKSFLELESSKSAEDRAQVAQSSEGILDLRRSIIATAVNVQDLTSQMHSVLEPQQIAAYLKWLQTHQQHSAALASALSGHYEAQGSAPKISDFTF